MAFSKGIWIAMNELEVNSYINAAQEGLKGNPEYEHWMEALYVERKRMMDDYGCNGGSLEGILFEIWNKRIAYILDNKEKIDDEIKHTIDI